jgi:uncharacterized protein (DUF1778 family)
VTGKTRSAFLLEAAYKEAEEVLLDQKVFHLNDQQWQAFHSLLDMPPASHTMLKSFLQKKAPWEN